ncbi:MAG: superoxide dismutase family protein [Gemmatimonadota bacterium]
MKKYVLLTVALLITAIAPACAEQTAGGNGEEASARLQGDAGAADAVKRISAEYDILGVEGDVIGHVELVDGAGGVLIKAEIEGLVPGEHGFHLHETGRCEPPFTSAGGHYNPDGTVHGLLSEGGPHAGDLPNLVVGEGASIAHGHAFADGLSVAELQEDDGSALVIHAGADDYRTDPAGAAGERVACAAIVEE